MHRARPDGIPNCALHALPVTGLVFLANIINSMLRLQHFPLTWKNATIVSIPKSRKKPALSAKLPLHQHRSKNRPKSDPSTPLWLLPQRKNPAQRTIWISGRPFHFGSAGPCCRIHHGRIQRKEIYGHGTARRMKDLWYGLLQRAPPPQPN